MKSSADKKGFTLLEVMVASVIGAFIAMVSVGALRAVTAGQAMVNTNIAAADELRYAVELIRSDLANVYRDGSADAMKFVGTFAETDDNMMTSLTMRIVSIANTRRSQPEGDIHEVQYYLAKSEEKSLLMRRLYPVVGTEAEEELPGGVLTTIAENIAGFELMYFNGEEWVSEWPAELNSLPQMVEIVLATVEEKQGRQGSLVARKILAAFPRLSQQAQGAEASGQDEARTTEAGQNTGSSNQSGGGSSMDMRGGRGRGGGMGSRGRGRGDGGSDRGASGSDCGRGGSDRGRGGFDRGRGGSGRGGSGRGGSSSGGSSRGGSSRGGSSSGGSSSGSGGYRGSGGSGGGR